jgi:hypothetical protein
MKPEWKSSLAFSAAIVSLASFGFAGRHAIAPKTIVSPCAYLIQSWPVVLQDDVLGKYPVEVGSSTLVFNYPRQQACFYFHGNAGIGVTMNPEKKCVDMLKPTTKTFYVRITYADGQKRIMDINREDLAERWKAARRDCESPGIIPPPVKRPYNMTRLELQ